MEERAGDMDRAGDERARERAGDERVGAWTGEDLSASKYKGFLGQSEGGVSG